MRKRERERERGLLSSLFYLPSLAGFSRCSFFVRPSRVCFALFFPTAALFYAASLSLSLSLLLTFPPLACSPAFCLVGLMQCARARLFRVSCSAAIACVCVGIMRRAYLDWLGGWGSAGTKGWDDKIKEWVEFFSAEVKVKGNFEQ